MNRNEAKGNAYAQIREAMEDGEENFTMSNDLVSFSISRPERDLADGILNPCDLRVYNFEERLTTT